MKIIIVISNFKALYQNYKKEDIKLLFNYDEQKRIMKEYKIMEDRSYENLSKLFIDGFISCDLIIPGETVLVNTGGFTRTAATAMFGLTGLAATMGEEKRNQIYIGCLKASKEGLTMEEPLGIEGKKYPDWFVEWGAIKSIKRELQRSLLFTKTSNNFTLNLRNRGHFILKFSTGWHSSPITRNDFVIDFLEDFINRQILNNKGDWLAKHPPAANQDLSWI